MYTILTRIILFANLFLTEDTLHISMYFKRQLATLLAYNISDPVIVNITKNINNVPVTNSVTSNNRPIDVINGNVHCLN